MLRRSALVSAGLAAVLAVSACSTGGDEPPTELPSTSETSSSETTTSKDRRVPASPAGALQPLKTAIDSSTLKGTQFEGPLTVRLGILPSTGPLTGESNPWTLALQTTGTPTLEGDKAPKATDFSLWLSCDESVSPIDVTPVSEEVWLIHFPDLAGKYKNAAGSDAAGFHDVSPGSASLPVTLNSVVPSEDVCTWSADVADDVVDGYPKPWGWAGGRAEIHPSQLY